MIKCKICNKEFNDFRCLGSHIRQSHNIEKVNYYLTYITPKKGFCKNCGNETKFISLNKGYYNCCSNKCAKLWDNKNPDYRKKISITTKNAMWRSDVRNKFLEKVRQPKSKETIEKISKSVKENFKIDPTLKKRMYTKERNKKISVGRINYLKLHPEEKIRVGSIWKIWKARDEAGWRKHLLNASKKGFEKIFAPCGDTSLEIKLYTMLSLENLEYNKKYELNGKIYDAYLPKYNVLIEIDGEFWHKNSLEECKYKFQVESFHNDKEKEKIALNNGLKLIRIKEKHIPKTITEIL